MYATVEGACRDDRAELVGPWHDHLVA